MDHEVGGPSSANAPRIRAAVQAAVLREHAARSPSANLGSAAVALLLLAELHGAFRPWALAAWLAALAATLTLRIGILLAHRRRSVEDADAARWLAAYRGGALAHGIVWGAVALALASDATPAEVTTLAFLLGGLACGAMTLSLFDLTAALCFSVPLVLPLAVRVLADTTPVPSLIGVTAAMVAALFACFTLAARTAARERVALAVARQAEAEGAEDARRAEAMLRLVFDNVGLGIGIFDSELRLAAWNTRALELSGLDPAVARVGTPMHDCLLALARSGNLGLVADPEAAARERLADIAAFQGERTRRRTNARGRTIQTRRSPLGSGGFVLVFEDVTDKVRAEDQVRRSGEMLAEKSRVLAATLDALTQGVLSVDAGGRVNAYNQRALELLEVPEPLLTARPLLRELVAWQAEHGQFGRDHELLAPASRRNVRDFIAGEPAALERHYRRAKPDGTLLDVDTRVAADGSLVRTYTDVTASVQAEHALRESESRFRTLADSAPALIWVCDTEGRQTWFNQRWLETTGRTLREELLAPWSARLHPEDLKPARAAFEAAFAARAHYEIEYRLKRADGGYGWIAETGVPRSGPGGFEGYVSYGWEISERKAAKAALVAAKEEAERANRAKSDFLSRMSHELRTPLNAILGFGQLLESDRQEPLKPAQLARVQEMLRGGRHLLALINEVLDLARIESGTLQLNLETVDLAALVDESLRLVAPVAQERAITLAVEHHAGSCHVRADRLRLQQVLLNLLSNAIKYNRSGGSVRLACRDEGERVRLAVSDRGRGISESQRPRLFQAFERLDADRLAVEGAGIGLALSKWLVDLMGGEIGVESEIGVGSTFWVTLARADPAAPPPAVTAAAEPAPPPARDRTVLYIEDNPVNQVLMEGMLSHRPGIRLLTADRPGEGLTLAAQLRPDLVLLDIQLPGMDGFEVLRRLRSAAATSRIPVVAVSANAMPSDLDQARRAGFADYLTKPVDLEQLLEVVDRSLA